MRPLLLLVLLAACWEDEPEGDDSEERPEGDSAAEDSDGDGVTGAEDCDEADADTYAGAPERCDGVDDDCDGEVDEEAADAPAWYADADGDGYGDGEVAELSCEQPAGYVADATDCDDSDPAWHPGADEPDCTDPNDYNCDASVGYADADGDGFAACVECDDTDDAVNPDALEECDGADNNCDGTVDEATATDAPTWYADTDGDAFGAAEQPEIACDAPEGFVANATDCDDSRGSDNPAAAESCDTYDNDCDASVDEDDATDATTWYLDADGDGHGDSAAATTSCTPPDSTVPDATDCDDGQALAWTGAEEVCDGVDNDCDGTVDNDDAIDAATWYADADADGHGDPTAATTSCTSPESTVPDATDCDDGNALAWTGAGETCDGADNDCDGTVDNDDATDAATWYADADTDGYGDAAVSVVSCEAPAGCVADDADCNDTDATVSVTCAEPYTTTWGHAMLVVEAGTFTMGGGNADPAGSYIDHEVTLTRTFWLGEHEVTQEEYAASGSTSSSVTGADLPVYAVWEDAALYANALSMAEGLTPCYESDGSYIAAAYTADPYSCPGYRLPTEAEWEYAARAGEDTLYSGSDDYADVGWIYLSAGGTIHDVCSLDTNDWGFCDMTGNVFEWVNDWYDRTYGGYGTGVASTDPPGPTSGTYRLDRGGGASSGMTFAYNTIRCYSQYWYCGGVGFRLARTAM